MPIKSIQRRDFLKQTSILTAGLLASRMQVIAGPFAPGESGNGNIPLDKKLDPEWIKSLYKRGTVTTYLKSKNELQYIGMPVGGINCGTVYLRGDGRLWLWDIFNKNQEGIEPKEVEMQWTGSAKIRPRDGSAYVAPAKDIYPLEQGFAVKIEYAGKSIIKKLAQEDWDEIAFEATYPLATIRYIDKDLPVEISLQVYSPFIALDEDNSGLPATVFSFHINNKSTTPVKVSVIGWLENKTAIYSAKKEEQERFTKTLSAKGFHAVEGGVRNKNNFATDIQQQPDYGTMCIASLNNAAKLNTTLSWPLSENSFDHFANNEAVKATDEKLIGAVINQHQLLPGKNVSSHFVISWYFPNLKLKGIEGEGRYYQNKFKSAGEVSSYIQQNFKKLSSQSRLWKETWYDSTLPWWFLERTFLNISTLATTTSHRFDSGRFYGWEGVGCCPGTCTHVWQYAQAVGRIFPALERDTRERVDLGLGFVEENGMIWFRAEAAKSPAIDGQAGTILRIYREHQMSGDDTFLKNNWEKIKKAIQFVINQDKNKDGMEDTPMENTLDAVWDGEIAWIVGLCIAAVKAGEMMANEMNDVSFALVCKEYVEKGRKNMEEKLFNGEYFIHRPDAEKGRKNSGSYNTCHIDQVYGQSWAFQAGLGRILDGEKTKMALQSLWKYNFTPDVGSYIKEHTGGRPYALAGEGGMIMNTNPKNEDKPYGEGVTWQLGYFHECMSGFEHQVASHLMAEDMTDESLVLTRVIHDRYHAYKRNPFNEIECSDHYARAMASHGTFITACGFEYHGPKSFIRFAPKWNKENFKAPFVTAKGWGSYSQKIQSGKQAHRFEVKYGALRLQKISLQKIGELPIKKVIAVIGTQKIQLKYQKNGNDILLDLIKPLTIQTNETLIITIQ
ncbi:GH116 family glycosyl-hydrolase [Flavobacterium sp. ZB4P13]|uniref:GH116 family glycosyl-hydrolase n=1 Tax=Flavobacterium sp. ZB4P13 TaxID=3401728 RepID=UPI003AABB677